ncbi:MAG TPA: hypothetical protein VMF66_16275, partial [Candidatus Acidoferrum sp.]|nr:hypothetical protein [Candidatus Acidoferrum sp.]
MSTATTSNGRPFLPLILAALGIVVFLGGLILGSRDLRLSGSMGSHEAVISKLESPFENPRGYLISASAVAICGALMLPAVRTVFLGLRETGGLISGIGSLLLALGFLGEIALGCLARLWSMYDSAHIILAFATFIAISAGLTICLALAARLRRNYGLLLLAAIQLLAVATLIYMLFNPDFPPERSFLTSLAF